MTNSNFSRRAQRGGAIAVAVIFRALVFFTFLPIALRYALRGQWWEAAIAFACAIYLGALLTPTD